MTRVADAIGLSCNALDDFVYPVFFEVHGRGTDLQDFEGGVLLTGQSVHTPTASRGFPRRLAAPRARVDPLWLGTF